MGDKKGRYKDKSGRFRGKASKAVAVPTGKWMRGDPIVVRVVAASSPPRSPDPDKSDLYRLIDELPPSQIDAARKYLRFLIADADEDAVPLSAEERESVKRGKAQVARGETVSLKDLKRELGEDV